MRPDSGVDQWITEPQSWNLYSYTRNNPVNSIDPDGQWTIWHAVSEAISNAGERTIEAGQNLSQGGILGTAVDAAMTTIGEAVQGIGDSIMVGDATGTAIGEGASTEDLIRAGAQDLGRGSTLALTLATPAQIAGVGKGAVATETAATQTASKSAAGMADDVANMAGKNRVSAKTAGGKQIDIDLKGKAHYDKATQQKIDTPHVHESQINVGPNGQTSVSGKATRAATKDDVRNARRILEHRQ